MRGEKSMDALKVLYLISPWAAVIVSLIMVWEMRAHRKFQKNILRAKVIPDFTSNAQNGYPSLANITLENVSDGWAYNVQLGIFMIFKSIINHESEAKLYCVSLHKDVLAPRTSLEAHKEYITYDKQQLSKAMHDIFGERFRYIKKRIQKHIQDLFDFQGVMIVTYRDFFDNNRLVLRFFDVNERVSIFPDKSIVE
ncbi:hypothetical protein DRN97_08225 [Methanosarcinales archaeon]|nr:MAG: hypothetical protein DRN97_08225 [Methanosarcinales archaeon]